MKKLLFVFALICNMGFAQIPKPQKNTYVNDFAHVLSAEDIEGLNVKIAGIEKTSGVQLAIVLVKKIPAQYDIQDFSLLIGRKWHVGNNKRGLVYVAAIKQHKQRIEVARNLDSIFNNQKCAGILDEMKPSFKNEDYAAGLQILVAKIADEYSVPAVSPQVNNSPVNNSSKPVQPTVYKADWLSITVAVIFVAFVILIGFGIVALIVAAIRSNGQSGSHSSSVPGSAAPFRRGTPYHPQTSGHHSSLGHFAAGAAIGAAAGYAAQAMQDDQQNFDDTDDNSSSYADSNDDNDQSSDSSWGNWGSSDDSSSSDSSSSDSGYSDSGYSDSGSSDSGSSDSGATSDW